MTPVGTVSRTSTLPEVVLALTGPPPMLMACTSPEVACSVTPPLVSVTVMFPDVDLALTAPVAPRTSMSPEVSVTSAAPIPVRPRLPECSAPVTATPAGAWISYDTLQVWPQLVSMCNTVPTIR